MSEKAFLLSHFTDILNQTGADSAELQAFRATHPELAELFNRAVAIKEQLRRGELRLKAGDLEAVQEVATGKT